MLTTEGSSNIMTYKSKCNHDHAVPAVVYDCNLHMRGVDLNDMKNYAECIIKK